jgi:hypothetical protein
MSQSISNSSDCQTAAAVEHEFSLANETPADEGHEERRFPRFSFRSCLHATVYPPPGNRGQEPRHCQVLTRDLSRGGMSLLHKEQLFPQQTIDVVLQDGLVRRLEVMWCRRLGTGCYSAGCRFIKLPDEPTTAESNEEMAGN